MNNQNETRLKACLRIELVENRLKWLYSEIAKLKAERDTLTEEHTLLTNLKELYEKHPNDSIDAERPKILEYFPKSRAPRGGLEKDIIALLETGQASVHEILDLLPGRSKKSVHNTCSKMCGRGIIIRVGHGVYALNKEGRQDATDS